MTLHTVSIGDHPSTALPDTKPLEEALWLDTSAVAAVLKVYRRGHWWVLGEDGAATRMLELYDRIDSLCDLLDELVEHEDDREVGGVCPDYLARVNLARRVFRRP